MTDGPPPRRRYRREGYPLVFHLAAWAIVIVFSLFCCGGGVSIVAGWYTEREARRHLVEAIERQEKLQKQLERDAVSTIKVTGEPTAGQTKSTAPPNTNRQSPSERLKLPKVEITPALKELGAKFTDWRVGNDNDPVFLDCKVTATTHALDSNFAGRTILVRYYDRQGVVYKDKPGLRLELKPGETGRMEFFLQSGLKLSDVTRIVLDCE